MNFKEYLVERDELKQTKDIFFVKKGSPAWEAIMVIADDTQTPKDAILASLRSKIKRGMFRGLAKPESVFLSREKDTSSDRKFADADELHFQPIAASARRKGPGSKEPWQKVLSDLHKAGVKGIRRLAPDGGSKVPRGEV